MRNSKKVLEEHQTIHKMKAQGDRKIAKFEAQIVQMQEQEHELALQLRDAQENEDQREAEMQHKLTQLQKEVEKKQEHVHAVESENARQKNEIERKTAEVEHARKQVQEYQQREQQRGSLQNDSRASDEKQAWLDNEIEKYLSQKQIMGDLEKRLCEREMIIQEREQFLTEKNKLELKRMRESHSVEAGLQAICDSIGQMDSQLASKDLLMRTLEKDDLHNLQREAKMLQQQRNEALEEMKELQLAKSEARFLNEKDERRFQEVEDRIQDLHAQVEYKSALIKEKQESTNHGGTADDILLRVERMPEGEARTVLKRNVMATIMLKQQLGQQKQGYKALEIEVQEKDERIAELEEGLRHADMEQDRIITRMEQEHAEEIQRLVQNTSGMNQDALAKQQEELETANKDLYYYKQSYREIKRTLKKIQTVVKDDIDKKQKECDVLRNQNLQLNEELVNLKQFLSKSSSGMAPVRVSRSSLKGMKVLGADEVAQRKSHSSSGMSLADS